MAKQIDRLKYIKVKDNKLKGLSNKQALLQAGYSEATAGHHASEMSVLKRVKEEIEREFRMEQVTPQKVLEEIETVRQLALETNDLSTAGRMAELKGKYLAMFTDKSQVKAEVISTEEQGIVNKYISTNRLCNKG